jgi:hypothetical protein
MAGVLWGLLALFLAHRAVTSGLWAGVLFAPVIGLIVGLTLQPWFEARNGIGRGFVSLVSLYFGATLFAVAIAIASWSRFRIKPVETLTETVLGIWWGVTLTGFLLFLWPLAYFTHWLIEMRNE